MWPVEQGIRCGKRMGILGYFFYSFHLAQAWRGFDLEIESVPGIACFRRGTRFKKSRANEWWVGGWVPAFGGIVGDGDGRWGQRWVPAPRLRGGKLSTRGQGMGRARLGCGKGVFHGEMVAGEGEFRQWGDVRGLVGAVKSADVQDTSPRPEIVSLIQEIAILDSI